MSMTDKETTKAFDEISRQIDQWMERYGFDTFQVFATSYESNEVGTRHIQIGRGNIFARTGHLQNYLMLEEGRSMKAAEEEEED